MDDEGGRDRAVDGGLTGGDGGVDLIGQAGRLPIGVIAGGAIGLDLDSDEGAVGHGSSLAHASHHDCLVHRVMTVASEISSEVLAIVVGG